MFYYIILSIFCSKIIIFVFKDLTGMSPKSPYEEPKHPELSLDTVSNTIDKTVNYVIEFLVKQVRLLLQCPHTLGLLKYYDQDGAQ